MKVIKEGINNVPEVKDAIAAVDIVMAKAKEDSDKAEEETKEYHTAEHIGQAEPFTGHNKKDYPKKPEEPKATLDESLFDENLDEAIERSSMSVIVPNTKGIKTPEDYFNGSSFDFSSVPEDRCFKGKLTTHNALKYLLNHKGENLLSIKLFGVTDKVSELVTPDGANVELIDISSENDLYSPSELKSAGCGGEGKLCYHEIFVQGYASNRIYGNTFDNEKSIVRDYLANGWSVIQYVNFVNPQVAMRRQFPRAKRDGGIDCGFGTTNESLNEDLLEDDNQQEMSIEECDCGMLVYPNGDKFYVCRDEEDGTLIAGRNIEAGAEPEFVMDYNDEEDFFVNLEMMDKKIEETNPEVNDIDEAAEWSQEGEDDAAKRGRQLGRAIGLGAAKFIPTKLDDIALAKVGATLGDIGGRHIYRRNIRNNNQALLTDDYIEEGCMSEREENKARVEQLETFEEGYINYTASVMHQQGLSDEIGEMREAALYGNCEAVCESYLERCNNASAYIDDDYIVEGLEFITAGIDLNEAKETDRVELEESLLGKEIYIIEMKGEPNYTGLTGEVQYISEGLQIHGDWGGLALDPSIDSFEIIG